MFSLAMQFPVGINSFMQWLIIYKEPFFVFPLLGWKSGIENASMLGLVWIQFEVMQFLSYACE